MEVDYIKCCDCAEGMRILPDGCIDLTVTSPPYDALRKYDGYSFDFEAIARELYRVTKDGGVVVWVVGDQTKNGSESGTSFRQALYFKEIGFNLHDTMIYQKANYIPLTHNRYEQSFEYMFVFSKGKPKAFNPIMVPCKGAGKQETYGEGRRKRIDPNQSMRIDGFRVIATKKTKIHPNIFTYTCGADKTGHPAPFPYKLAEDNVLSWSNDGDLILDPMCGSGTTLLAAKNLGRHFIGMDCSEEYCEMSRIRVENV